MSRPLTLSILGGLSILGVATGVALGRSAVSEINPTYFAEAPTRFHADQVPHRSTDWAQVQAAEYVAPDAPPGLGTGCFGCGARGAYIAAPPVTSYTDSWAAEAERAAAPVQAEVVYQAPDPEREQLVRYATYPISEEEAEAATRQVEAPAAPAPEADVAAGTMGL